MKIHLSLDITSNLVFKNNLFCSAGFEKSSFGGYYGISGNREPDEFLLLPMEGFVEEKHHFLCKDPTPAAVEKLDKTQIITKVRCTSSFFFFFFFFFFSLFCV
jgi:hypothetical protein